MARFELSREDFLDAAEKEVSSTAKRPNLKKSTKATSKASTPKANRANELLSTIKKARILFSSDDTNDDESGSGSSRKRPSLEGDHSSPPEKPLYSRKRKSLLSLEEDPPSWYSREEGLDDYYMYKRPRYSREDSVSPLQSSPKKPRYAFEEDCSESFSSSKKHILSPKRQKDETQQLK